MKASTVTVAWAACVAAVLAVCLDVQAGSVRLLSQERRVSADASAGVNDRRDFQQDARDCADPGRFDAAASAWARVVFPEAAPLEGQQEVTATQVSDLREDRIAFAGRLTVRGVGLSDYGTATSEVSTMFELSAAHAFWFDLNLVNRGELLGDRESRYTIQRLNDPSAVPMDLPLMQDLPGDASLLKAGTYRLSFLQAVDVAPGRSGEVEYKANFRLIPVVSVEPNGAEVSPAVPIPLPPAVWMALSTLVGAGAAGIARQRWRAWRGRS